MSRIPPKDASHDPTFLHPLVAVVLAAAVLVIVVVACCASTRAPAERAKSLNPVTPLGATVLDECDRAFQF